MEETLEQRLEAVREQLEKLRPLVKSAGWDLLNEIVNEQISVREHQVLSSHLNTDEEINEARLLLAERAAFKVVMMLPATIIEQLEEEMKNVPNEE